MDSFKKGEYFVKNPDGTYKKLGKISAESILTVPGEDEDSEDVSAFREGFTAEVKIDCDVRQYHGQLFTMKQIVFPGAPVRLYLGDEPIRMYKADRILTEDELRELTDLLESKVAAALEKKMMEG